MKNVEYKPINGPVESLSPKFTTLVRIALPKGYFLTYQISFLIYSTELYTPANDISMPIVTDKNYKKCNKT